MPLPEDESEWKNLMVIFATSKGNIRKNTLEDFININTELENFRIEIFDLLGKKIFQSHNSKSIDVTKFDKGTYLLKISSGYNHNSKLFIIK